MIICTHFSGIGGRDVLATVDCEGTLFQQWRQAYDFLLRRLDRSWRIDGAHRVEELEVPEVAIREAILNMVVHRNYHLKGPGKIAIFDDRIEFFSPGGFPGPIDPRNLRAGVTYLRNPAICKVFREAGLVEKLGSGLIAIADAYEERGLSPPQLVEGVGYVKCVLPRGRSGVEPGDLLHLFDREPELSVAQIASWTGVSRATVQRRIKNLVDQGLIARLGSGPTTRYFRPS